MKRPILIAVLFAFSIAACTKKNDGSSQPDPEPVDKVVATHWCELEKGDDNFQVVTRYEFKRGNPNSVEIKHLSITDKGNPILYKGVKPYVWENKKDFYSSGNHFTVELLEDQSKIDATRLERQRAIFEKELKGNPNLKRTNEKFSPTQALRVQYNLELYGKDFETVLFPCSDYSKELAANSEARSALEFELLVGQYLWKRQFSPEESTLARLMSFIFPMEQLKTADIAIEGSSWCSWSRDDKETAWVSVMTLGKERFILNQFHQTWLTETGIQFIGSEDDRLTEIYESQENQTYLKGKGSYLAKKSNGASQEISKTFGAIKDSKGVTVLVRLSPVEPRPRPTQFPNVFFSCDDLRPLSRLSEDQKRNLVKMIEHQKDQLRQLK